MDSPTRLKLSRALRLEGLVIQKKGGMEQPRYLVMDMVDGSISLYKTPPPKPDNPMSPSSNITSKLASSIKGSLNRAISADSPSKTQDTGETTQVPCDCLTYLDREKRGSLSGIWDPIFTADFSVNWKIRDAENVDSLFYLVLPSDFSTKESYAAEIVSLAKIGKNRVSFSSNDDAILNEESNDESESMGTDENVEEEVVSVRRRRSTVKHGTPTVVKRSKFKLFTKDKSSKQETILTFRVLLDGNEKFIWLTAAQEMNRLAKASAIFLGNTLTVTRHIHKLSSARKKAAALRYAEWARLVDSMKSVTKVDYDPRDITTSSSNDDIDVPSFNDTELIKIKPYYAYKNRKMTLKELEYENIRPSEKWEDLRNETIGDRDEPVIGSLHVEVLSCHGLPKLDTFSLTDACCYLVCGPFAFATDVIELALHPSWPSKSRRACIFPIFYTYQKLFVGVFDNDGASHHDDFAGRVVVDMSSLRPNSLYDVYLPLRLYQNVYTKEARGVVRLRLRLEWENERMALLSYLRLPKKVDLLENAITLNCSDPKAFRNVVLTVQGLDVPGRYKPIVQKGLQREMKLYKDVLKNGIKELMKDIVLWVHPWTSGCIFFAWMHCVYVSSLALVPVYFLLGMNVLLYSNYKVFAQGDDYTSGFAPLTISELLNCLMFGGHSTNYLKPSSQVLNKNKLNKNVSVNSNTDQKPVDYMVQHSLVKIDKDHIEFPFSEEGRYPQKTLAEACSDAQNSTVDNDTGNSEGVKNMSDVFDVVRTVMPKGSRKNSTSQQEDGEDEDDENLELMCGKSMHPVKQSNKASNLPSLATVNKFISTVKDADEGDGISDSKITLASADVFNVENDKLASSIYRTEELGVENRKVWKRMSRQLVEQDATILVKSRTSLKQDLKNNKNLMHKMTLRQFDDRLFIADKNIQPGEKDALHTAIGIKKPKNPVVAKMGEFIAPALEMLKIGLSVFRAWFNLFTWRDPYLTFLFQTGSIILICILIVFPWRKFFLIVGVGLVGPQNFIAHAIYNASRKETKKELNGMVTEETKEEVKTGADLFSKTPPEATDDFRFHNHLVTNGGIDLRDEKKNSSDKVYRAIVPNSPLLSRRFYDWPPNPSLSSVNTRN